MWKERERWLTGWVGRSSYQEYPDEPRVDDVPSCFLREHTTLWFCSLLQLCVVGGGRGWGELGMTYTSRSLGEAFISAKLMIQVLKNTSAV